MLLSVYDYRLSKSRFCAGLQCLKQLWWRVHEPDAPELAPGPELTSAFGWGHRVGEAARALFAGGTLVSPEPWSIRASLEDTTAALRARPPAIFEASFAVDGVFAAIDVLQRLDLGHALVEVKSTWSVKPQHLPDVALQVLVARGSGMEVRRAEVMHVAPGGETLSPAFARVDVTGEVERLLPRIPALIAEQRAALAGSLPTVEPGPRCRAPYPCPFLERCHS